MPEQQDAAPGLIGLTPQKGRNVEQIVFLAQTRPVIRLKRCEPRLSDGLRGRGRGARREVEEFRPAARIGIEYHRAGHARA